MKVTRLSLQQRLTRNAYINGNRVAKKPLFLHGKSYYEKLSNDSVKAALTATNLTFSKA